MRVANSGGLKVAGGTFIGKFYEKIVQNCFASLLSAVFQPFSAFTPHPLSKILDPTLLGKISRKGGPIKQSTWFKCIKKNGYGVKLRKLVRIPFLLKITLNSPITSPNESIKKKVTLVCFRFNTVYFRKILSVTNFDTEYYISLQISLLLNGIKRSITCNLGTKYHCISF